MAAHAQGDLTSAPAPSRGVPPLIVVTGLPRSGTSMAMRMLGAGGVELVVDDGRPPDAGNPHGYFEHGAVRRLHEDASWLARKPGRAVKIVVPLLPWVPVGLRCDVVWMRRPLAEVLASQRALLAQDGSAESGVDEPSLVAAFRRADEAAERWAHGRAEVRIIELAAEDVVRAPDEAAARLEGFLRRRLDRRAMAQVVDPPLLRSRSGAR